MCGHDPYDDFCDRDARFEAYETADATQPTAPTSKTPQIGVQGRLQWVDDELLCQRISAAAALALNDLLTARHNPTMMLAILAPAWKGMGEDVNE